MRKLISLVLILAMPAMVFAAPATDISVKSGGLASLSYVVGSAPATIPIELAVSTDAVAVGDQKIWAVGGGLLGPAALSATAITYKAGWAVIGAYVLPAALDSVKDWGAMDGDSLFANGITAPGATVATLTISGVSALPVGVYTIAVTDSASGAVSGTGYWMNGDGSNPVAFGTSTPLSLTIKAVPEPATMLLLAVALPFLRRRSA